MADTETAARKAVTDKIKAERAQLQRDIKSARATEKEVAKEQEKASAKAFALAKKNGFDSEPTLQEETVAHDAALATRAFLGITRKLQTIEQKIAALDDPAEIERRVQAQLSQDQRISALVARTSNDKPNDKPRGRRQRMSTIEIPKPVGDRIKKALEDGKSTGEVADKLRSDKVKPVFYGEWTNRSVRRTYKVFTGKENIPARAKNAGRKLKDRAPAPTRKVTANGNGKKTSAAKPLTKAAQASGTSRGGTGSKKKKTAAARK